MGFTHTNKNHEGPQLVTGGWAGLSTSTRPPHSWLVSRSSVVETNRMAEGFWEKITFTGTRSGTRSGPGKRITISMITRKTWWFHGDFMAISWWFHGDFMVISWWFHGDFMDFKIAKVVYMTLTKVRFWYKLYSMGLKPQIYNWGRPPWWNLPQLSCLPPAHSHIHLGIMRTNLGERKDACKKYKDENGFDDVHVW